MSNIALVTDNMLPVANETFIDNLSAGISAGAAIVPINSLSEYSDGDSVVLTVDPGTASQATFIGEKQGNTVINCKWTEGNVGASHAAGATVIDYDSSTHYNVVTKLLRMFANENGSLKTTAVQQALNISSAVPADWTPLATAGSLVASQGDKYFQLIFNGVDYTDRLQKDTKLRIPRSIAPPTTCADFEGSTSQYASKASPAGINLTSSVTIEGHINYESYTPGQILSRRNGTAGWSIEMMPGGLLSFYYSDGTNSTAAATVNGVPVGKNVHFAATCTFATKTIAIYLNGVLQPIVQTSNNATSVANTGTTLYLGSYNGASLFYDGLVSDLRLWSTVRTQAELRDNANKLLVGNETGLIGYWKLNGTWNDSTANANHFTASGGAINNFAAHPFKAIEYAKVVSAVYSGGNTTVTVFTGFTNSIPNEVLGAISFSNLATPYGFPSNMYYSPDDMSSAEIDTGAVSWDGKTIFKKTYIAAITGSGSEQTFTNVITPAATRVEKVEGGISAGSDFYAVQYVNPAATTVQNAQTKLSLVSGVWQARVWSGATGTLYLTCYYVK